MDIIEGRTALVTGAATGIGAAIGEALVAAGAKVVLTDRDASELDRTCTALGPSVRALQLDVTDRVGWHVARRAAEESFGPVQILVNNAGVGPDWKELADTPPEHFDTLVAIMLTGVFNGIHTFGAKMRELGEGHIVNMSSMVGLLGPPRQGAYVAAKFGVVGLSETLRAEMEPHGVGVSVVCPGRVRSNLIAANEPAHLAASDGMDPRVVAARVVAAIRDNDLYVITHPEHRQLIADRATRLLDAFDRVVR